ncbi:MAG: hypothetical protein EOM58_07235 [Clostridia bacterium]|nr:hypothetical protein [Clostridia bacterium]
MIKRLDLPKWLAVALMMVLSYAVFFALAQRPGSDISIHATWAAEGDFAHPRSFFHHGAHPLWHMVVAAVLLTGLPLAQSAALVTTLFKGAEVWLLVTLAAQIIGRKGWLAALSGMLIATASAVLIVSINPTVYGGVGSPNPWHSPTQMAVMVLMLLCVPLTARYVEAFRQQLPELGAKANISWRQVAVLAVFLVMSLAAKPTFMQAFLPAACLYFLVMWIRKPKNSPFFLRMIAAAAPAVLVMIFQYLYYFGIIVPSQGEMVLQISWAKVGEVAQSVWMTRAFPLFVLLAFTDREAWRSPLLQLTLVMDIVSILEMLLLGETGRRATDGNFNWAMMGSALMLWAVTLPLFARQLLGSWHRKKAAASGQPYLANPLWVEIGRWSIGSALLIWHLVSGGCYLVYLLRGSMVL